MKVLVVYYSHSGNTARLAQALYRQLEKRGEAKLAELRHSEKRRSFLRQIIYRLNPSLAELEPAPYDVKEYDIVCVGSPSWGGRPATAIMKYLKLCKNLAGKTIVYFHVYASLAGAERTLSYVTKVLKKKGASRVIDAGLDWHDGHNEEEIDRAARNTIEKLG